MGRGRNRLDDMLHLDAMAVSAAYSDVTAIAKLSWLLSTGEGAGTHQQLHQHEGQLQLLHTAAPGAAASGSLPVLQWLHARGATGPGLKWPHTLVAALQQGHVAAVDWLVDVVGCPLPQLGLQWGQWGLGFVWRNAGLSGSMGPVRWLLGRGVPAHQGAVRGAAQAGNLEAVKFLHASCGLRLTPSVFSGAAGSRSMPIVTWLLQAGCPMDPWAYCGAAAQGDVDMVLWLAQVARCPWIEKTLSNAVDFWPRGAASTSQLLPTVRALVEAGCPLGAGMEAGGVQGLGSAALDAAVRRGDLPLARYLHEECGVGFGTETMVQAAAGGCEAVLEWLVEAGCGLGTGYPYMRAAEHGDLATMGCLCRLGVPLGGAGWWRKLDVNLVPLAAVEWLVERGAPWDDEAARKLVAKAERFFRPRGEELVSWLKARVAERG